MSRVEADTELRMIERTHQLAKFFECASREISRARGIFDDEIHAGLNRFQHVLERPAHPNKAFITVALSVRAEVRVHVANVAGGRRGEICLQ